MNLRIFLGIALVTITTVSGFSVYAQEETPQLKQSQELDDTRPEQRPLEDSELGELKAIKELINHGKAKEAHQKADLLIKSNPELGEAYFFRGFASLGLENMEGAMNDMKKSAEMLRNDDKIEVAERVEAFMRQVEEDMKETGKNPINQ